MLIILILLMLDSRELHIRRLRRDTQGIARNNASIMCPALERI